MFIVGVLVGVFVEVFVGVVVAAYGPRSLEDLEMPV